MLSSFFSGIFQKPVDPCYPDCYAEKIIFVCSPPTNLLASDLPVSTKTVPYLVTFILSEGIYNITSFSLVHSFIKISSLMLMVQKMSKIIHLYIMLHYLRKYKFCKCRWGSAEITESETKSTPSHSMTDWVSINTGPYSLQQFVGGCSMLVLTQDTDLQHMAPNLLLPNGGFHDRIRYATAQRFYFNHNHGTVEIYQD